MRGENCNTLITIFANDTSVAPRYRNSSTKQIATLELNLSRVAFSDKLRAKKKKLGGHWYHQFDGVIEASYGSALVTYTLKLNGKFRLVLPQ